MGNGKLATIIAQNFDGRQLWQIILLPKIFWQINIDRLPALLSKPARKKLFGELIITQVFYCQSNVKHGSQLFINFSANKMIVFNNNGRITKAFKQHGN